MSFQYGIFSQSAPPTNANTTLVSDDPFPKVPPASMAHPSTVPFLPEHVYFGIFRDEEQEDVFFFF